MDVRSGCLARFRQEIRSSGGAGFGDGGPRAFSVTGAGRPRVRRTAYRREDVRTRRGAIALPPNPGLHPPGGGVNENRRLLRRQIPMSGSEESTTGSAFRAPVGCGPPRAGQGGSDTFRCRSARKRRLLPTPCGSTRPRQSPSPPRRSGSCFASVRRIRPDRAVKRPRLGGRSASRPSAQEPRQQSELGQQEEPRDASPEAYGVSLDQRPVSVLQETRVRVFQVVDEL